MRTIARLFGKSPFAPLQTHMGKVGACMEKLSEIFNLIPSIHPEKLEELSSIVSKLEHEADLTKNDIRNHLPRSLFLPIDRHQLLDLLAIQDSLADKAETIATLLAIYTLEYPPSLTTGFKEFYTKNFQAFLDATTIIYKIDDLLESSFGGVEAEKVKEKVEETSYKEYESEIIKRSLLKTLFQESENLSTPSFYLWTRLIEEVGELSHIAEKLANRIRMILELK